MIRDWAPEFYRIQSTVRVLRWPPSKILRQAPLYTEKLVKDLLATKSPEEYLKVYHTLDGKRRHGGFNQVRRVIDPTPVFDPTKPYPTVEFRISRGMLDADYLMDLGHLGMKIITDLIDHGRVDLEEVTERVKKMEANFPEDERW
jgi:hypothetical protein